MINKLKKHFIPTRQQELNPSWVQEELDYLANNEEDINYILYLIKNNKKVKNNNSSSILYIIGVTDDKPKKNVDSICAMADIDSDVAIDRRQEIIDYVRNEYGEDKVFHLTTFVRLKTKAAIKDVARAFDVSFEEANEITNHVPHKSKNIEEALEKSEKLREFEKKYKKVFTIAKKVEGSIKSKGVHASAVIVTEKSIDKGDLPLCRTADKKNLVIGLDMNSIDKLGYLKLDILGLKCVAMVDFCFKKYQQENL